MIYVCIQGAADAAAAALCVAMLLLLRLMLIAATMFVIAHLHSEFFLHIKSRAVVLDVNFVLLQRKFLSTPVGNSFASDGFGFYLY